MHSRAHQQSMEEELAPQDRGLCGRPPWKITPLMLSQVSRVSLKILLALPQVST